MLDTFDGGRSNAFWDIVRGDETWVYWFDPKTKQWSQQLIPIRQRPPMTFLHSHTIAKQMIAVFVRRIGHIATIPLATQSTVLPMTMSEHSAQNSYYGKPSSLKQTFAISQHTRHSWIQAHHSVVRGMLRPF